MLVSSLNKDTKLYTSQENRSGHKAKPSGTPDKNMVSSDS